MDCVIQGRVDLSLVWSVMDSYNQPLFLHMYEVYQIINYSCKIEMKGRMSTMARLPVVSLSFGSPRAGNNVGAV
jgi:hypothetical protein